MANSTKKIGILTSGGDCAGLNAAIRAVVVSASKLGWEVYGIKNGTEGLIKSPVEYEILTVNNFATTPWPKMSGSYLGSSSKGINPKDMKKLATKFAAGVKSLGLDAIIVVGGDGSMQIVGNYCKNTGVKIVGIPKTIDNDTPLTEFSIGFSTACQVCTDAIDSLASTARSHSRALILEVMGRDAGHLALHSAIAGGADVCLVPEIPYSIDGIVKKLKKIKLSGRNYAVIVAAEGVKKENQGIKKITANLANKNKHIHIGQYLSEEIAKKYKGFVTRVTVLGHLQRAGIPNAFDRMIGTLFGTKAVYLLSTDQTNKLVVWEDGEVKVHELDEVIKAGTTPLDVNGDYVRAAKDMDMYIGDLNKLKNMR